ncbi:O-succinylhomoserine (thiol)-lyase [Enemella evansiae]|uniref:cystathionine gamma-synthase n=1 Tax=Enemella evansiae TaxID=2016499 RepID=UPI000B97264E|nr:cystathionine gamma-synthase [Enemella evansiae]OYO20615.1 O-succinylhomoserine (thiol)-lyase [Enemella evansiae]
MTEISRLTRAIRTGLEWDTSVGAVVPPIHVSTNYRFETPDRRGGYDYSRSGNPTRDLLGTALGILEGGQPAVITGTGMGAVTTAVLACTEPGDTVAIPHDCYGGTWRLFARLAERQHLELVVLNFTDTAAAAARLRELRPTLVWLETPSNPLLRITDIATLTEAAHAAGALVAADNTFCSPVRQQPLDLGADLVIHSTTKYVNGHSDVVGGAVVAREPELAETIGYWANTLGTTGGALDAWLTLRGLRTLPLRMRQHEQNAAAVVETLIGHEAVGAVHYPGLPEHPGHELAARQQQGFGGMLSFELSGIPAVEAFLDGLACFSLAESLGGTESLVCHPGLMTHAAMPPEVQREAGITPGLLRLSVGIEETDDLVADVRAGLARAAAVDA